MTLRQVLVPSDVAGFTMLDKMLGVEVATITAATIFTYMAWHLPVGNDHNARRLIRRQTAPGTQ